MKLKPKVIYIFDEDLMDSQLNAFGDIDEYFEIRSGIKMNVHNDDLFFTSLNPHATDMKSFFKAQPLGEHMFRSVEWPS